MSIMVSVLENGSETIYFKLSELEDEFLLERPDSYSVKIPKQEDVATLVAYALLTLKKEEKKWQEQKASEIAAGEIFTSLRT